MLDLLLFPCIIEDQRRASYAKRKSRGAASRPWLQADLFSPRKGEPDERDDATID